MEQTTPTTDKKKDKNTGLYVGGGLLLIAWLLSRDKKEKPEETQTLEEFPVDTTAPKPIVVYVTKVLKMGTKGIEVTKLQELMKITADGFFGAQTEAMLYRLKGVKEVSLDEYAKLPTINRNILPNKTKVMSNKASGTPIYEAVQKADKTYYSTMKIQKTIEFGQSVGEIRSASADGNWYTVYYNDLWDGDFWTGTAIGFVRASEVEKI